MFRFVLLCFITDDEENNPLNASQFNENVQIENLVNLSNGNALLTELKQLNTRINVLQNEIYVLRFQLKIIQSNYFRNYYGDQ